MIESRIRYYLDGIRCYHTSLDEANRCIATSFRRNARNQQTICTFRLCNLRK